MVRQEISVLVKKAGLLDGLFSKKSPSVPSAPAKQRITPKTPSNSAARPQVRRNQHTQSRSNNVPSDLVGAVPVDLNEEGFKHIYDFYRDVAPKIRMRQLGVDKLPEYEQDVFRQLPSIRVYWSDKMKDHHLGLYHPGFLGKGNYITINKKKKDAILKDPSILAHELRHAIEQRIPNGKKEEGLLDKVFGFFGTDIAPWDPGYASKYSGSELFTTNKQHQFNIYEKLRRYLGKAPTAEEYFDYVKNMPQSDLLNNHRRRWVNGYQAIADKVLKRLIPRRIELYRKALMDVSRNESGNGSGWRRFAYGYNGGAA